MCHATVAFGNSRMSSDTKPMSRFASDLLLRHAMPEHAHLAGIRLHEAHQNADGGALARAVRADEAHDLARRELEAQILEREETECLADTAQLDGRSRVHFFTVLRSAFSRRAMSSSSVIPSIRAMRAAAARCSSSSCSCRFVDRSTSSGHERALAVASDDDAFAFQLEIGALHRDHAHAHAGGQRADRGHFLARLPVAHGHAVPDLLLDLQIHRPGIGLGDGEGTVHIAIHSV